MTITADHHSLRDYIANEAVTITRIVYMHRPGRVDQWYAWGSVYDHTLQKDMPIRVILFPEERKAVDAAGFDTSRWDYSWKRTIAQPDFTLYNWEQFTLTVRWADAHGWRINELQAKSGEWVTVYQKPAPTKTMLVYAEPETVNLNDIMPGDEIHVGWGVVTLAEPCEGGAWLATYCGLKRLVSKRLLRTATVVSKVPRPVASIPSIPAVSTVPLLPAPKIAGLLPAPRPEYDHAGMGVSYPKFVFPGWVTPEIASDIHYIDAMPQYVNTYLKYTKIAAGREQPIGADSDASARHAKWAQQAVLYWLHGVKMYGVTDHSGAYRYTLAMALYNVCAYVARLMEARLALIAVIEARASQSQSSTPTFTDTQVLVRLLSNGDRITWNKDTNAYGFCGYPFSREQWSRLAAHDLIEIDEARSRTAWKPKGGRYYTHIAYKASKQGQEVARLSRHELQVGTQGAQGRSGRSVESLAGDQS